MSCMLGIVTWLANCKQITSIWILGPSGKESFIFHSQAPEVLMITCLKGGCALEKWRAVESWVPSTSTCSLSSTPLQQLMTCVMLPRLGRLRCRTQVRSRYTPHVPRHSLYSPYRPSGSFTIPPILGSNFLESTGYINLLHTATVRSMYRIKNASKSLRRAPVCDPRHSLPASEGSVKIMCKIVLFHS